MVFPSARSRNFTQGNYWGVPSSFEFFTNYGRVFFESDMSRATCGTRVLITVPDG